MAYLDSAATTRPLSEALDRFNEVSKEHYGNPSSRHAAGFSSSRILEDARSSILMDLKVDKTHGLLFTSGASEANSLAIKGTAFRYKNRGKRIITSAVEHPSVLNAFRQLGEQFGFEVVELPVEPSGKVNPSVLAEAMNKDTILVSIMAVNNETGSVNDLPSLIKEVKKYPKALFHSDVTQAIGKVDIPFQDIDMLSFSAHKFGGLKGNGALIYRKSIQFLPIISGGDQENGYRAGTVDVAGASAMAVALRKTMQEKPVMVEKAKGMYAFLRIELSQIEEIEFNSPPDGSPFVLSVSLKEHKASVIVEALSQKGYYVSSVSACSSKGEPISYVVMAMGLGKERAANTLRISLCRDNRDEELQRFIDTLKSILKEVRPR